MDITGQSLYCSQISGILGLVTLSARDANLSLPNIGSFYFFLYPHTEQYLRKHSSRIFYLIFTHRIRLWKRKLVQQVTQIEEILILTRRIGLWKSNSIPKTSRILNTFRHHTGRISASISIFHSIAYPSDFPFRMGGTVQKWNDPSE